MVCAKFLSCSPPPRTPLFNEYVSEGRLHLAVLTLSSSAPLMVVTFYAYASDPPSGVGSRFDATTGLMEAVCKEVSAWPDIPFVLCGDRSADVYRIPSLRTAVLEGDVVDPGSIA
eukprot:226382-Alexandrium_andersonii.AAC.1